VAAGDPDDDRNVPYGHGAESVPEDDSFRAETASSGPLHLGELSTRERDVSLIEQGGHGSGRGPIGPDASGKEHDAAETRRIERRRRRGDRERAPYQPDPHDQPPP